jgi:hypothetical protein
MKTKSILMSVVLVSTLIVDACKEEATNEERADAPRTELTVKGGALTMLSGKEAGLSLDKFPQVKNITFRHWKKLKSVPETGVFIVEGSHIPHTFKEDLKTNGLTLHNDGTLTEADGTKATLFIHAQSFKVMPNKDVTKNGRTSGNPFPFLFYSYDMYWKYNGGYCRDYRAWTNAYAWGPQSGESYLPTSIEYIYAYVSVHGKVNSNYCYNCQSVGAYAKWDIGCFWPAHQTGPGYHHAFWKDGSITAEQTWWW